MYENFVIVVIVRHPPLFEFNRVLCFYVYILLIWVLSVWPRASIIISTDDQYSYEKQQSGKFSGLGQTMECHN